MAHLATLTLKARKKSFDSVDRHKRSEEGWANNEWMSPVCQALCGLGHSYSSSQSAVGGQSRYSVFIVEGTG